MMPLNKLDKTNKTISYFDCVFFQIHDKSTTRINLLKRIQNHFSIIICTDFDALARGILAELCGHV